jgi:16S rRNA (uracil1498-N3)-methyltransferase
VEEFRDGKAALTGEAAYHLVRVLRAEPGQLYELTDGREVYLARLDEAGRDAASFTLTAKIDSPPPSVSLTLLIAIVKFDRFEWAIEKATELGVDTIVPLAAARSGKPLLAAAPKRATRWRKVLLESAQQARRLRAPVLEPLARPAEAFRAAIEPLRILLSERPGAAALRAVLEQGVPPASAAPAGGVVRVSLAIGPEGGWTDEEFAAANAAGFAGAALGENILRTETAVVAGLAALQLYCDRR